MDTQPAEARQHREVVLTTATPDTSSRRHGCGGRAPIVWSSRTERHDTVELAVLLLMETLTPRQRAAYVLREGFGYPYSRISEILHLSVVNARQQVSRAQDRLAHGKRVVATGEMEKPTEWHFHSPPFRFPTRAIASQSRVLAG
ncbi:sigma factor-like helix-turn-helix DNA-binding protein [Streptomyces sp. 4N124]|uniref:sigma factor-like helix-turn-helix DNA-binding protein n=1 Tax=Streptomyces sp. 4N124 TaxID=3457420 RepID=UPI003FD3FFB6